MSPRQKEASDDSASDDSGLRNALRRAAIGTPRSAVDALILDVLGPGIVPARKSLTEQIGPLTPDQRKAVGFFIHQQSEASFQAGLRIGLMASLWTLALAYEKQGENGRA